MYIPTKLLTKIGRRTLFPVLLCLWVFCPSANAQVNRIDSLKNLAITTNFPERLEHIFTWYIETSELFHEPEMAILSDAIHWLEQKKRRTEEEQLQLARLKVALGYMYCDNEQLMDIHREAAEVIDMAENFGQNADPWMVYKGKAYFQLYLICYLEKRFEDGIPLLVKSYSCFEKVNDLSGMAQVENTRSALFTNLKDFEKANTYAENAARLYEAAGNEYGQLRASFYQAVGLIEMNNLMKAETLLRDLIPRMKETEHPSLNSAMANLGDVQAQLERYEAAETNLLQSLELAKERRVNYTIAASYQYLANMEEKRGDFGKALFYQRQQAIYLDSIRLQAAEKGLKEAQAKFDQSENENKIKVLERKIAQERRAAQQKMLLLALGLISMGIGLYWFLQQKKKAEIEAATHTLTLNMNSSPEIAQKTKVDPFLQEFLQIVKKEMANDQLSVESIASSMRMSRVQLFKKVKNATESSPSQIIRQYRLESGKKMLLEDKFTISEIAYQVGFRNPNSFSRAFKDRFGDSPSAFLSKSREN